MINIQNLTFGYEKGQVLFKSLDLIVGSGKICGLLGKNGAGKTTLLRQFLGLIFPDEGVVLVHGEEIRKRDPEILKEIFYVQEEFDLPAMPIRMYKKIYAPFYEKFDSQKFYDLLKTFEVDEAEKINKLSFGQKKKVLLAFALSTGVKLLILDEPTNGLDIPSKAQFRKILVSSLTEDQSVIISSHQVRDLTNMLDQVIILEEGGIILNEDVFDIATVLDFKYIPGTSIPEHSLYHEMVPGGNLIVMQKTDGGQSNVDIEALFNAVIQNAGVIGNLFKIYKTQE